MKDWTQLKWPRRRSTRTPGRKPRAAEPIGRHRRTLLVYFDAWRDAAADVEAAWRRWRSAPPASRAEAALGFFAALEREEKAASVYELAWQR